ncbi:MAG: PQQ-binding-like beta-propeller repeat protein [Chloroflexi bacterium]|nr:PQQ-binding-like beta-propeller repeat protein [Chloroflexota bacterium]
MTNHLTNDELNSYLHQTLADAEREALNRHLADCPACRTRLNGYEALQRRIRYELATELRGVQPSSQKTFAAIAPRLKRSRRFTMIARQSKQFIYGALTMALLMAVGVGLYFFLSNLSQPTPTTPEQVKQPTIISTVEVSQPVVNPTAEVSQPAIDTDSTGAMLQGNLQRTGIFDTAGPAKGELKWKFAVKFPGSYAPAIAEGTAYVGSNDGYLYAVDIQTGQEKCIAAGVVYVGSQDHHLYAVEAQTGREKWRFKTADEIWNSSSAVAESLVYINSADGQLYALDTQTGQERWHFDAKGRAEDFSPAVAEGLVYMGSAEGHLYALDAQSGQERWKFKTKGTVWAPAIAEGVIYIGSTDGNLYALDSQTGQEKWYFAAAPFSLIGWSAIADGVIYFGSDDGYLYAVR